MRALFVVVFLLFATGCGDRSATEERLDWVRDFAAWENAFVDDVDRAETLRERVLGGRRGSRDAFADAVADVRRCGTRFDEDVGIPSIRRLRQPAELFRAACREFARGEQAQLRALHGDPGELLFTASIAIDRGTLLLLRARRRLDRSFAWNRPLPRVGGTTGVSRIEPRFSAIAARVAHRESAEVRCWSIREWRRVLEEFHAYNGRQYEPDGFVSDFDSGHIHLAPWICAHLVDLAYARQLRRGDGGLELADAVDTLAHESEHLAAPGTEAETECYAVQAVRAVARALGAPAAYADELARRQWRENYPSLPPEYRTAACFDGGPLDARPASGLWP